MTAVGDPSQWDLAVLCRARLRISDPRPMVGSGGAEEEETWSREALGPILGACLSSEVVGDFARGRLPVGGAAVREGDALPAAYVYDLLARCEPALAGSGRVVLSLRMEWTQAARAESEVVGSTGASGDDAALSERLERLEQAVAGKLPPANGGGASAAASTLRVGGGDVWVKLRRLRELVAGRVAALERRCREWMARKESVAGELLRLANELHLAEGRLRQTLPEASPASGKATSRKERDRWFRAIESDWAAVSEMEDVLERVMSRDATGPGTVESVKRHLEALGLIASRIARSR